MPTINTVSAIWQLMHAIRQGSMHLVCFLSPTPLGRTFPRMGQMAGDGDDELFPRPAAAAKEVLQNMYRYRAANPVFSGAFVDQMEPARDVLNVRHDHDRLDGGLSNINGQIMEVYEHLLHIITGVGFSKTWPSKWGLTTSSDLYLAMQEAIGAGAYDVSSYAGIDAEARTRIELQEFAYWALSTARSPRDLLPGLPPEWTRRPPHKCSAAAALRAPPPRRQRCSACPLQGPSRRSARSPWPDATDGALADCRRRARDAARRRPSQTRAAVEPAAVAAATAPAPSSSLWSWLLWQRAVGAGMCFLAKRRPHAAQSAVAE